MMRLSSLFILLFACNTVAQVDETLPLTKETCDSKLYRANDLVIELSLERDTYKKQAEEAGTADSICASQFKITLDKLRTCNTLTSIYDNQLIENNCVTAVEEVSDD